MKGGIYILTTPAPKKSLELDYRVAHAYDIEKIWQTEGNDKYDKVNAEAIHNIFNPSKIYNNKASAHTYATHLFYKYELSDPELVNDGINFIFLDEDFKSAFGRTTNGKNEIRKKDNSNVSTMS